MGVCVSVYGLDYDRDPSTRGDIRLLREDIAGLRSANRDLHEQFRKARQELEQIRRDVNDLKQGAKFILIIAAVFYVAAWMRDFF